MIPKELEFVLSIDPEVMSGEVCFSGTRVPVRCLFDTLEEGDGLSVFLDGWPDVTELQAMAVIVWEQNQARKIFGLALTA